jgi:thiol:disulfide interchange protein DsbD
MFWHSFLRTFLSAVSLFLGVAILPSTSGAQVKATLVLASESSNSAQVAVRLDHAPGWHTYWSNPGTGQATKIDWTLPSGWKAGDIDWPVPSLIKGSDGEITGHGYEGTVYLPVTLTISPQTHEIGSKGLKANVNWLMCQLENCIPGSAELTIPGDAKPDPQVGAALTSQPMPYKDSAVSVRGGIKGDTITLAIAGLGPVRNPHFFPASEMIWHDAVQAFEEDGSEASLTAPIDKYWEGPRDHLSGILAFTDASGKYRGLIIDAPIMTAAVSVPADANGGGGLAFTFVFALLGGLILNLMPCVLPVLSIKALSLAQGAGGDARREGLHYAAGVMATFAFIGGVMLILRATMGGIGWGFQLQNPYVVLALALLMAGIGFNLVGMFEVGMGAGGVGQGLLNRAGRAKSFLTGALAVIVATPCTAPFMAAALGVALLASAPVAVAIFVVMGLGMAAPFLLLAYWPKARGILPKPGAWMVTLRTLLAFPMFATAIWLLWVLGSQRGLDAMALGLVAIVALALAFWALGKARERHTVRWRVVTLLAAVLIAVCGWMMPPTSSTAVGKRSGETALYVEEPFTPAALDAALASGQPVFAYFTADWCVTCKLNERVALHTTATTALFEKKQMRVLVGDWTSQNPDITAILAQYGRAGVPLYLYFPPGAGAGEAKVLPQLLTNEIIAQEIG